MDKKRLRIFAGANGSGKSTFIKTFQNNHIANLHIYVNADELEVLLKTRNKVNFNDFKFLATTESIQNHFKISTFRHRQIADFDIYTCFKVIENKLIIEDKITVDSYIAADIADYIRQNLVLNNLSFSFETVMSNENKIEFLKRAKQNGYKIYLYFFATKDPEINVSRVKLRVKQGGHDVKKSNIIERYYKGLKLLKSAINISNNAYLFDTSNNTSNFVAQIINGKEIELIPNKDSKDKENNEIEVPDWIKTYVLENSI